MIAAASIEVLSILFAAAMFSAMLPSSRFRFEPLFAMPSKSTHIRFSAHAAAPCRTARLLRE